MAERFFVPQIGQPGPIRLTGDEAHHLAHVRRIAPGARVRLFDGSGVEWEAVVEQVGKREVLLAIVAQHAPDRELPFALTLACSPPKGERLRWLVEKATELGVTQFVPLRTERTPEHAGRVRTEKIERWVIEGSKQCGRNVLMQLAEPMVWPDLVDFVSPARLRMLAHPVEHQAEGESGKANHASAFARMPGPSGNQLNQAKLEQVWTRGVAIAVGPEGGFTDAELELGREHGWVVLDLGPRTLRIETAALAVVARLTVNLQPATDSSRIPSPSG